MFSRFSWNDGRTEGWVYNDSNWAVSFGTSVQGAVWRRANDALVLGYVRDGISRSAQEFLALGGASILDGDGGLTYGTENVVEAYYNLAVWKGVHVTPDYEFVVNPASNRARGPVSVFGIRLHAQF